MKYIVKHTENRNSLFVDRDGHEWHYISDQEMTEIYPNDGFKIIGVYRISKKSNTKEYQDYILDDEFEIGIEEYQKNSGRKEICLGYIPIICDEGDDCFIQVVKPKKNKLIFLLILFIAMFFLGLYFLNQPEHVDLDSEAISYHYDGLINKNPEQIALPVYQDIYSENGNELKINFSNPEGNPCYFKYKLSVKIGDNWEEVYQSGYIKPGMAIPKIKMSKTLEPGDYDGDIQIMTFDLNDINKSLNGGEEEVNIHIKGELDNEVSN